MKKLVVLIGLMLCLIPSDDVSAKELRKMVASCAKVAGPVDRLSCYDEIASAAGPQKPQPTSFSHQGTGNWRTEKTINPLDDSEAVVLSLVADSGQSRWGKRIFFVARCEANKTEAYIMWHDYIGDDSSSHYDKWKYVTTRVGDNPAVKQKWSISSSSKATFAPGWPVTLLKQM
ncbi:MAG: hypothetical protein AAF679_14475, partial [Pseudomonadota bacterium]